MSITFGQTTAHSCARNVGAGVQRRLGGGKDGELLVRGIGPEVGLAVT